MVNDPGIVPGDYETSVTLLMTDAAESIGTAHECGYRLVASSRYSKIYATA